jgi:L-asparagine oxygenase
MTQQSVPVPCAGQATTALHGTWESVTLTEADTAMLAAATSALGVGPDESLTAFRAAAIDVWAALDVTTRTSLSSLAVGRSGPVVFIKGLPAVRDLPATPTTGQETGNVPNFDSDFLLTVFTCQLGLPISYLDQRKGRLTHDLYPTRANAEKVSSQSSKVDLGHHTEMFFHPTPPDFLALHCLRADPEGKALTGTAAVEDIKALLRPEDIQVLSEPVFAADLATLHGMYSFAGSPIGQGAPRPAFPVFGDPAANGRFRFEPALTTALTSEAVTALINAEHAAEMATAYGHLETNSMVVFDNRRVSHARTRFTANFDGTDRWLRRMMIGMETGYHERHDLELVKAWEATDAVMGTFPYAAEGEVAA